MNILGDLAKSLLGGGNSGGAGAGLGGVVSELLSPGNGGLEGLVQKFQAAGAGDLIKGWISTGPNPAIAPDQLQAALGPDMIGKLAQSAGIKPQDLLGQLSAHLPQIIDSLTPNGAAPAADGLQDMLGGVLGGLLKKS